MDKNSSEHGRARGWMHGGRRFVPPRVAQRRRGARPQSATWDGARRWWFIALGWLAASLLLAPGLVGAQGLRSQPTVISLTVVAPPRVDATRSAIVRGESVTDVTIAQPTSPLPPSRIDVRLESGPQVEAGLWVRGDDGQLRPLGASWRPVAIGRSSRFRAIASNGAPLSGGTWRVRYRLTPADPTLPSFEESRDVVVPSPR